MQAMSIHEDAHFNSYEEFERAKHAYEQQHFVNLATRRSTQLKGPHMEQFKYASVTFWCNKGGRSFQMQGRGMRKTKTMLVGCPMYFKLRFNKRRQRLTISEMVATHSSDCTESRSQEEFIRSAPQRKIRGELREEVKRMMAVGANKKAVQAHLMSARHKAVTLKDLHNIAYEVKRRSKDELVISDPSSIHCPSLPPIPENIGSCATGNSVSKVEAAASGTHPTPKDRFQAFGDYVAQELKNVDDPYSLQTAKRRINEILFEATTGQYRLERTPGEVIVDSGEVYN